MSSGGTTNSDELVDQVVEVTNCSTEEAKHYLGACGGDVAAAVALFFEQGGASASTTSPTVGPSLPVLDNDGDEEVRAPIAPVREQLILPEDDNFFASGSSSSQRLSRVSQRVKVCPLRDFAREGELMEEQLQATGVYADPATHRRRRERSAQMVNSGRSNAAAAATTSTSRLGDLFRPPTDILYSGSWTAAREFATKRQRWLLVNVQGDDFHSQTMNRDVWSNKELKTLVRKQFTLWQVDNDTSEGRRFVAFYHCAAKLPYLCIIDPRTGEEVWRSPDPKQDNVLPDLKEFLRVHRDFGQTEAEEAPSTSKRAAKHLHEEQEEGEQNDVTVESTPKKRARLLELTEEEQFELAIKNSMNENGQSSRPKPTAGSDCESLEEFDEDEIKDLLASVSYESHLGQAKEEVTALKLRLLNDAGNDEVVQLRWPSDTKLQTLRLYIRQMHKHIPLVGYKLICAFPRKTLEVEHNQDSLKDLGLHPSANLHLTLDD